MLVLTIQKKDHPLYSPSNIWSLLMHLWMKVGKMSRFYNLRFASITNTFFCVVLLSSCSIPISNILGVTATSPSATPFTTIETTRLQSLTPRNTFIPSPIKWKTETTDTVGMYYDLLNG